MEFQLQVAVQGNAALLRRRPSAPTRTTAQPVPRSIAPWQPLVPPIQRGGACIDIQLKGRLKNQGGERR